MLNCTGKGAFPDTVFAVKSAERVVTVTCAEADAVPQALLVATV